ncbi:MAG TPA: hypothetical protein VJ746_12960 [Nitrospira sp.]|nr:hypothetical protein [Nitrospira sp.]
MRRVVFVLAALWAVVQVTEMIWTPRGEFLGRSLAHLAEPPVHHLTDPYRNAYFHLIGFSASPSSDPAKVGYDMWVESREIFAGRSLNYDGAGRSDLHVPMPFRLVVSSWDVDDPLTELKTGKDSSLHPMVDRHRVLLERYDRCLGIPFEDWGFGQRATPRYEDIMVAHRLYIAEGFARSAGLGLDRLHKELVFWRIVLREAATTTTKVAAQVVIQDDAKLLSRMLSRPTVDKQILEAALQLMVPMTKSEYSLRWPIQHQVALAARQNVTGSGRGESAERDDELQWLSGAAHFPVDAFDRIEHPTNRSVFSVLLGSQRTADIYAVYYDRLIDASMTGGRIPRLREIERAIGRGIVEGVLDPTLAEPDWDIILDQLMETDTRLRLTSLQVHLRKPNATAAVPSRLAEVGSRYFDPFSGFPMLWSPTQQKLYSVGRDRLDDGGDPSFDISVPAIIAPVHHVVPRHAPPSGARRS